jgi:hypothetical protein
MTAGISNAKIAEALKKTHGNYMLSAKMLGCSRVMIWQRVKKSPDLQRIVDDERAGFIDVAEGALYTAVLKGDAWAIAFVLKGIGKERGHSERVETVGKDGGPVAVVRDMSDEEIENEARKIFERRKS